MRIKAINLPSGNQVQKKQPFHFSNSHRQASHWYYQFNQSYWITTVQQSWVEWNDFFRRLIYEHISKSTRDALNLAKSLNIYRLTTFCLMSLCEPYQLPDTIVQRLQAWYFAKEMAAWHVSLVYTVIHTPYAWSQLTLGSRRSYIMNRTLVPDSKIQTNSSRGRPMHRPSIYASATDPHINYQPVHGFPTSH